MKKSNGGQHQETCFWQNVQFISGLVSEKKEVRRAATNIRARKAAEDRLNATQIAGIACLLAIVCALPARAQSPDSSSSSGERNQNPVSRGADYLLNYLNMAGTTKASQFQPMDQQERTHLYFKTMINPFGFIKAGFSAGLDQWSDKPSEWEQGASGYGKRYANILGQYSIQRTVTFGLSSLLHEDNRYFNSGKQGLWPRLGYALSDGMLARHDDGSRHFSFSQTGGVAAGAFLSRLWLPKSQNSAGDGAVSFGITMGSNIGFGVLKEFLPDLARALTGKKRKSGKNFRAGGPAD
jgi:hypothetical protein